MLKELREFIIRGNVLDMAVGIIIGAAFGTIVRSFVDDIIMPPIGLALGRVDFANMFVVLKEGVKEAGPYASLAAAKAAGATTLNYGAFVNLIINFLIVSLAVFLMVRGVNRLRRPGPARAQRRQPRNARVASRRFRSRRFAVRTAHPTSPSPEDAGTVSRAVVPAVRQGAMCVTG